MWAKRILGGAEGSAGKGKTALAPTIPIFKENSNHFKNFTPKFPTKAEKIEVRTICNLQLKSNSF